MVGAGGLEPPIALSWRERFIREALQAAGAALSKRFFRWHRYKFSIDFGRWQNVDSCQANFEFDSEQRRPHLTCHLVTPFIFRNENAAKWLSRFFLAGTAVSARTR